MDKKITWNDYETFDVKQRFVYRDIGIILYSLNIISSYPYINEKILPEKELKLRKALSNRVDNDTTLC